MTHEPRKLTQREEPEPALGPSRGYCPSSGGTEPHWMASQSAGKLVRFVEICKLCGWIDAEALDGWAENAIKVNATENAQNIALAAGTKPFAFVQREEDGLKLEEVLGQALGAASMCWDHPDRAGIFNSRRAKEIYVRLYAEVRRFQRLETKEWRDLSYELYALLCNSQYFDQSREGGQKEWEQAFERLRERFHALLSPAEREELPDGT
jgi:hypothetical protein